MARFRSTAQLLRHARDLMERLDAAGHDEAAAELRSGFLCLNGLTDGWALFLAAIERVHVRHGARFGFEDRDGLEQLRRAVRSAVHGQR